MMAVWLFLAVSYVCLWFVIVVFPNHTHILFLYFQNKIVFKLKSFEIMKISWLLSEAVMINLYRQGLVVTYIRKL